MYQTFDNHEEIQQEDSSECLMMLIEIINKGSVPHCGSHDNNSTEIPLISVL